MQAASIMRRDVMLQGVSCQARGFARLEGTPERMSLSLQAMHLPLERPLRLLLLCGGEDGTAQDLGLMQVSAQGGAVMHHSGLAISCWEAIVIAADWPDAQLVAIGTLRSCSQQALQRALSHYLSLPREDSLPAPVQEEPSAPAQPQHPDTLQRLNYLHWPACFSDLRRHFVTQTPCAPFDAPGWRFVRVSLTADAPAAWGYLGRHATHGAVDAICWAIPGQREAPPSALHGYRWVPARHGEGYFITLRTVKDA